MRAVDTQRGRLILVLVLSIGTAGMASTDVNSARPDRVQASSAVSPTDTDDIRETVVRYQAAHLTPDDLQPSALARVVALCVGFEKSGGVDPTPTLLARLKDVRPPVVAYSTCVRDGFQGRLPIWVTAIGPSTGTTVQARGRSVQNYYLYVLERRPTGWAVTMAQLTGRGAPANKRLQPTARR